MNDQTAAKAFRKNSGAECEAFWARLAQLENVSCCGDLLFFLLNARRGRQRESISIGRLAGNGDYFVTRLSFGRTCWHL